MVIANKLKKGFIIMDKHFNVLVLNQYTGERLISAFVGITSEGRSFVFQGFGASLYPCDR